MQAVNSSIKQGAKRLITPHDKKVATNAKTIYQRNKKLLGLTNQVIGDKLEISQSAVSQYLSGSIAMGANIIIKLADVLHVNVVDIDPKFNKRFRPNIKDDNAEDNIAIIGTTSGRAPLVKHSKVPKNVTRSTYAVLVDSDLYFPTLHNGTTIGADPLAKMSKGSNVLFRRIGHAHFEVMQVLKVTAKNVHLSPLVSPYTAKKYDNHHYGTTYSLNGDVVLPWTQIITLDKIVVSIDPA